MAVTLVQQVSAGPGALFSDFNEVLDLPGAATAGNLIVVIVFGAEDAEVDTIDDAGTTTYALAARIEDGSPNNWAEIWYGVAAGASAGTDITVTANFDSGFGAALIVCAEFAGTDADQSGITFDDVVSVAASTHTVPSVTPPTADNVMVGIVMGTSDGSGYTGDADFTSFTGSPFARGTVQYKIQSAATAQAYTVTNTGGTEDTVGLLVAFKGTGGGGGGGSNGKNCLLTFGVG